MTNDAAVLEALNFDPPCQGEECLGAGVWAGTCACCHLVTVLCEMHLRKAYRRTVNGATCGRCRHRAESLTELWWLNRTDRLG